MGERLWKGRVGEFGGGRRGGKIYVHSINCLTAVLTRYDKGTVLFDMLLAEMCRGS